MTNPNYYPNNNRTCSKVDIDKEYDEARARIHQSHFTAKDAENFLIAAKKRASQHLKESGLEGMDPGI